MEGIKVEGVKIIQMCSKARFFTLKPGSIKVQPITESMLQPRLCSHKTSNKKLWTTNWRPHPLCLGMCLPTHYSCSFSCLLKGNNLKEGPGKVEVGLLIRIAKGKVHTHACSLLFYRDYLKWGGHFWVGRRPLLMHAILLATYAFSWLAYS